MWPFRPDPVLDEGTTAWLVDAYAWAFKSFGSDWFLHWISLVLPNDEFFPDKLDQAEDVAQTVFDRVREHAGLHDWPCELVAQEPDVDPILAPAVAVRGTETGPAGTFSITGRPGEPVARITYNPAQLRQPMSLVATFAHELAHYLSCTAKAAPPGGDEFEEYATDLLAVFMGFGVFLANSAFSFHQYADGETQGWAVRHQGYLSERELTFALAIFMSLKGIDQEAVEPYLAARLLPVLKKSFRALERRSADMDGLRALLLNEDEPREVPS